MPAIAAGSSSAVLSLWQAAEGDALPPDGVAAIIETEKAQVDLPVDTGGVLLRTLVSEGAEVEVGAPIALMADVHEAVDDVEAVLASLGHGSGGDSPEQSSADDDEPQHVGAVDPPSAAGQALGSSGDDSSRSPNGTGPSAAPAPGGSAPGQRLFTSPLARRLARESGLAVEQLQGTGPGGRIVRRDVEAALEARAAAAAPAQQPAQPVAAPAVDGQRAYTDLPHSRIRKATAARLTESMQTAPHFYLQGTAIVDELVALRARVNGGGGAVTLNDLIVKAAARAHSAVPAMNVIWTPEAVRSFSTVDIAVAVATERGLVTPVLRSVDAMTLTSLSAASADLVARARAGQLRQSELEGGSLTVTNLGMYGTKQFSAIINPPQAAILAVGAARQEPVVRDGDLQVGTVMHLTLSVDHRPVDGAVAAQWMRAFVALLEDPVQILV
jgi:pyruvate dehydrogenase E2 component (dihydrolipoamide acetyltransferase)